jgi:phospholipase C
VDNMRRSNNATRSFWPFIAVAIVVLVVLAYLLATNSLRGTSATSPASRVVSTAPVYATTTLPRPDHIVIVMEENHAYSDIIGSSNASYISLLARQGAVFTQSYAITHPSQPNYLALFSGSTQGVSSDNCPQTFSGSNLGSSLLHARLSFIGYSESMPENGYTGCYAPDSLTADYARKHNPWVDFTNVPASSNLTFNNFPTNYNMLPTVSFVIPNQYDDMHSASVQQGDSWLQGHLSGYAQWARAHNSLLIITWDEDDGSASNQIPTLFIGSMVKPGRYSEQINHYSVLRTIEDMYGLPALNESANVGAISDVWQK